MAFYLKLKFPCQGRLQIQKSTRTKVDQIINNRWDLILKESHWVTALVIVYRIMASKLRKIKEHNRRAVLSLKIMTIACLLPLMLYLIW